MGTIKRVEITKSEYDRLIQEWKAYGSEMADTYYPVINRLFPFADEASYRHWTTRFWYTCDGRYLRYDVEW